MSDAASHCIETGPNRLRAHAIRNRIADAESSAASTLYETQPFGLFPQPRRDADASWRAHYHRLTLGGQRGRAACFYPYAAGGIAGDGGRMSRAMRARRCDAVFDMSRADRLRMAR
ncbi:hypothetical protein [Burkholderia sp. TSV86]|uniref:hypothetical protein n=1 Tax=Burkholderia sp. TSV86 TaxID=1385594 RepID=UPI00075B9DA6|nr:hypothetical protein [Burkholderia sp. TSV86]KVE39449.1 hypothetical protein WS68_22120 [Burkholderia sp. TSV86]